MKRVDRLMRLFFRWRKRTLINIQMKRKILFASTWREFKTVKNALVRLKQNARNVKKMHFESRIWALTMWFQTFRVRLRILSSCKRRVFKIWKSKYVLLKWLRKFSLNRLKDGFYRLLRRSRWPLAAKLLRKRKLDTYLSRWKSFVDLIDRHKSSVNRGRRYLLVKYFSIIRQRLLHFRIRRYQGVSNFSRFRRVWNIWVQFNRKRISLKCRMFGANLHSHKQQSSQAFNAIMVNWRRRKALENITLQYDRQLLQMGLGNWAALHHRKLKERSRTETSLRHFLSRKKVELNSQSLNKYLSYSTSLLYLLFHRWLARTYQFQTIRRKDRISDVYFMKDAFRKLKIRSNNLSYIRLRDKLDWIDRYYVMRRCMKSLTYWKQKMLRYYVCNRKIRYIQLMKGLRKWYSFTIVARRFAWTVKRANLRYEMKVFRLFFDLLLRRQQQRLVLQRSFLVFRRWHPKPFVQIPKLSIFHYFEAWKNEYCLWSRRQRHERSFWIYQQHCKILSKAWNHWYDLYEAKEHYRLRLKSGWDSFRRWFRSRSQRWKEYQLEISINNSFSSYFLAPSLSRKSFSSSVVSSANDNNLSRPYISKMNHMFLNSSSQSHSHHQYINRFMHSSSTSTTAVANINLNTNTKKKSINDHYSCSSTTHQSRGFCGNLRWSFLKASTFSIWNHHMITRRWFLQWKFQSKHLRNLQVIQREHHNECLKEIRYLTYLQHIADRFHQRHPPIYSPLKKWFLWWRNRQSKLSRIALKCLYSRLLIHWKVLFRERQRLKLSSYSLSHHFNQHHCIQEHPPQGQKRLQLSNLERKNEIKNKTTASATLFSTATLATASQVTPSATTVNEIKDGPISYYREDLKDSWLISPIPWKGDTYSHRSRSKLLKNNKLNLIETATKHPKVRVQARQIDFSERKEEKKAVSQEPILMTSTSSWSQNDRQRENVHQQQQHLQDEGRDLKDDSNDTNEHDNEREEDEEESWKTSLSSHSQRSQEDLRLVWHSSMSMSQDSLEDPHRSSTVEWKPDHTRVRSSAINKETPSKVKSSDKISESIRQDPSHFSPRDRLSFQSRSNFLGTDKHDDECHNKSSNLNDTSMRSRHRNTPRRKLMDELGTTCGTSIGYLRLFEHRKQEYDTN